VIIGALLSHLPRKGGRKRKSVEPFYSEEKATTLEKDDAIDPIRNELVRRRTKGINRGGEGLRVIRA